MNIEIRDTITLDDKEQYVVAGKTNYQNETYYYLVCLKNKIDIKFCLADKNDVTSLTEVTDPDLIEILLPLFYESAKDFLPNDIKN